MAAINIHHAINIRSAVRETGYGQDLFAYNRFHYYSTLDIESFRAMDFGKLTPEIHGVWLLYREGFTTPHRAYVLNRTGNSVAVYGR